MDFVTGSRVCSFYTMSRVVDPILNVLGGLHEEQDKLPLRCFVTTYGSNGGLIIFCFNDAYVTSCATHILADEPIFIEPSLQQLFCVNLAATCWPVVIPI